MKLTTTVAPATLVLHAFLLAACDGPDTFVDPDPAAHTEPAALMGGVANDSPTLDAIGSLALESTSADCAIGGLRSASLPICTATLIAPRVIVTAKHCIGDASRQGRPGFSLYFVIGPDRLEAQRHVSVIDWLTDESGGDGWNGNGHDVAAMILATPIDDIAPVAVAAPRLEQIGRRLSVLGYGIRDETRASGTRRAGVVTLNALEGKVYESMFHGDFAAFRSWYLEDEPAASERVLREAYDATLLLPGYEAHVGARPGDAQPCHGDSGGPLLESVDGHYVSYGVTSGGVRSQHAICTGGAIYATFGPDTLDLLARAQRWEDPCEGVSVRGHCEGDVVHRCSALSEGSRALVVDDCAAMDATCVTDDEGRAACAAAFEKPTTSSSNSLNLCPDTR
jgi:hypothetical protein